MQGLNYFPCFLYKNKKLLMFRSMNILIISLTSLITKLSSFCLEIFSSYYALSAFRNIFPICFRQNLFCRSIISFVF